MLLAFVQRLLMCWVYVCCVSSVTPRILLWLSVVKGVLLMWSESWVLCSLGSGVESDNCVFVGLMWRLLRVVQSATLLM